MTFTGSSPQEALKKVQHELGDEAMLIETREIQKKALGRDAIYEVVVGVSENHVNRPKKKPLPPAYENSQQKSPVLKESQDVLYNISEAAKQISKIAEVTIDDKTNLTPKRSKVEAPEIVDLKKDIEKLTDKVKIIQNMFWEEKHPDLDFIIPPEFAEIYSTSLNSGMNKNHLDEIMKLSIENMPLKMRQNSETVKRYFQTLLRKMIPVRHEKMPSQTQKKVIMVVGPTGVGKTTSIAKLAARYAFNMKKKHKVGLIVLDTYRIGAVEQLMQYARMMKLGIETVLDPPEFSKALDALRYCDYILIDTMGSSPYDQKKIETIYSCLEHNDTNLDIDVMLALSSSSKYEDMKETYDNFSTLNIDTLMFTKLDETRSFGNIFSLSFNTKQPISYFSIGQEVPEDLVVASSDYLINCMINGFNKGVTQ
ncbi:MAG: flagellar biosynthesis protein FlhF [Campylobacterota bacterium]|nr:flagellar biosynthesis protein FlhF [Campylobacterota bacterium]